jgi:RHS repeat-associated protein
VTKPVAVTVHNQVNEPFADLNVYAFDGTVYTGYHGVTDGVGKVSLTLPQGAYRFRADYNGVQFWSGEENSCLIPSCESAVVYLPGGLVETDVTIDYTYDPLNRLTAADYNDGTYFHYAYDLVGNRLLQESKVKGITSSIDYEYDIANRLTGVGGVPYEWDDNGNLLSDGSNHYSYNSANRLISVIGSSGTFTYAYDGLGNRYQQTVNGVTTTYTLDIASGLTQVMEDGTYLYLYGNDRIAQESATEMSYFLGDALGSVRQLTDDNGVVTLTQNYDPYGNVIGSEGTGVSMYGFDGEQTDSYIKLINLRSRLYDPSSGRFQTRDSWQGNYSRPLSLNRWTYVEGNPVNREDPTGYYYPWTHYLVTLSEVLNNQYINSIPAVNGESEKDFAESIAYEDMMTDFRSQTTGSSLLGGGEQNKYYHFSDLPTSRAYIDMAIRSLDKYQFSVSLHRLQDFFSHRNENYYTDHGANEITSKVRTSDMFYEFYTGIKRTCHPRHPHHQENCTYEASTHTEGHPYEEILHELTERNLGLDLSVLTENDLLDLYLRYDGMNPSSTEGITRQIERDYFGFDTDRYFTGSARDNLMLAETHEAVNRFMINYLIFSCK